MLFGLGATKISRLRRLKFVSRQNVGWSYGCAERASWFIANFFERINAALWTSRNFPLAIKLDVRCQIIWEVNFVTGFQILFQRKLIGGSINLPEVIDASIL